jgi:hypothetical protein
MRFTFMLVAVLIVLLGTYYATVVMHFVANIFGSKVTFPKVLIPFYGWTKIFKH